MNNYDYKFLLFLQKGIKFIKIFNINLLKIIIGHFIFYFLRELYFKSMYNLLKQLAKAKLHSILFPTYAFVN